MMQKFIVEDIADIPCRICIKGQDAKHIHKVLRLKPGDRIHLTNGKGIDYKAKIHAAAKNEIHVDIFESHPSQTESPLEITLCNGMLKDKKMDLIIKHVTQLGIYKWIPFYCERSIPKPDGKRINKRVDRWHTIARESLKQCRRSFLPAIAPPVAFDELLKQNREYDHKIAFWEKSAQGLSTLKTLPSPKKKIIILIGPEGGFSEREIELAENVGFSSFLLGPRILRAETASISSCTLIQHLLGDI